MFFPYQNLPYLPKKFGTVPLFVCDDMKKLCTSGSKGFLAKKEENMKYIQGVPTCLPTGREDRRYYFQKPLMIIFLPAGRPARRPCLLRGKGEISWNFACKVDKKATFHTA